MMDQRSSRLLGAADRGSLVSQPAIGIGAGAVLPHFDVRSNPGAGNPAAEKHPYPPELAKYFSDNVYLSEPWHNAEFFVLPKEDSTSRSSWRNKERMKTVAVALVLCLNIGTDPPESSRPAICARKEAWVDPVPSSKKKSLETIGNSLQKQYEKWQGKAKFKQCLDPTPEDLHRVCINMRKTSKSDRILFHYNGHGTPRPTKNGELWVFGKNYTHYMPVPVFELKSWLGEPAIYVLDCSGAGSLIPYFYDSTASASRAHDPTDLLGTSGAQWGRPAALPAVLGGQPPVTGQPPTSTDGSVIVLAACRSTETLPVSPQYPADIFSACLTTPIQMALKWFYIQVRKYMLLSST
jgi:regulator-associated protein of mTOR